MDKRYSVRKRRTKIPAFKFMAMSKLIGILAFVIIFMIVFFCMREMHDTGNYDALPQLIISAFGFASIYSGFYLTMAKIEHVEEERTLREKELLAMKKELGLQNTTEEDIERKRDEIESLRQKMNDLLSESSQNLL